MTDKTIVIPRLGQTVVEDSLVYYDGLVLFSVRSGNGGRFVGFWASENDKESIYWYSPIPDSKYSDLLRGKLEVRKVFTEPQEVLQVQIVDNDVVAADWITPKDLDEDALPEPGYCLVADEYDEALSAGFVETAHVFAVRAGRAVARIIFDFGPGIHQGPANPIASAIVYTQKVVDALAFSKTNEPKDRGAIPADITTKTSLLLRPIVAGSLGIELVSNEEVDMFQESIAGRSLEELIEILQAGADQAKLKEHFKPLVGRTAKHYKELLRSFVRSGAIVSVETGVPRVGGEHRTTLPQEQIREMVEAMEAVDRSNSIEHVFPSVLVGYDSATRWFHLRRIEDGAEFKGKATGKAAESANHATINQQYKAHMLEMVDYDSVTDEPTIRYELIELD